MTDVLPNEDDLPSPPGEDVLSRTGNPKHEYLKLKVKQKVLL